MKKSILIIFIVLFNIVLIGCDNNKIGKEEAKKIALEHSGVLIENVDLVDIDYESEDNIKTYDVKFNCDGKMYTYQINDITGEVMLYDFITGACSIDHDHSEFHD